MSGLVTTVARAAEWAPTTREEVTNQMCALVRREGEGGRRQIHTEREKWEGEKEMEREERGGGRERELKLHT